MSLSNPTVSVVMPIFTHTPEQLTTAIYSILNQTFSDLELIIVDGRLNNANYDIISAINDSRIKYFKIKGYVNCLDFGISQAKGKYIARMDSDDISFPNRIAEQVKFLDENPDISLCSCLLEFFNDERFLGYSTHTIEVNSLFNFIKKCEFAHTAMMFRKNINLRYENFKPLEDCLLFRNLLLSGYKFAIIDKVLLKSYQAGHSLMARYPKYNNYLHSKIDVYALAKYYDFNLSFADVIMSKKSFSEAEIIEFLNFVSFIEKDLKKNGINASFITEAYFSYMVSKVKHRAFLLKNKLFYQTFFKLYLDNIVNSIIKNIFSVTNEYNLGIRTKENKQKILRIFGLKIKLK